MLCLTLAGAALAVLSASIIYAILGLVATMFGIAALYIYLDSPFIAMMQILIYVGAVSVLIAFAVMLAGPLYRRPKEWTTIGRFTMAVAVALVSFAAIVGFLMEAFPKRGFLATKVGTKAIGKAFVEEFVFPFELISLLIVVAIVGAIMLALYSRGRR